MPEKPALPPGALIHAIEGTKVWLFGQDTDLRYRWALNLPAPWNEQDIVGRTDEDLFPRQAAMTASAAKRHVLDGGERATFDLIVGKGADQRVFSIAVAADRDGSERVVGLTGSAIDVTEERRRQATLRTLLREVSHRSKNLLAVVQSIAAQTARSAPSPQRFVEQFSGRLQSLSRSQDLITATDWTGTRVRELIATQVDELLATAERRVSVTGADPVLTPNATIHVGLALHELAILAIQKERNAPAEAPISVEIALFARPQSEDDTYLRITWLERDIAVQAMGPQGDFGTTLLTRIVPASVGGSATLTADDDIFRYELEIAPDEFVG